MQAIDLQTELNFARIMLATDFSPVANIAQAYAVGLALHDSSALELATILDLSFTRFSTEVIPEFALEELRRSSEEDLQRAAETISGLKLTRRVIEGFRPASLIVNEAVSSHADLIVLGTTSKHGLKKLALGSTAEEVIRTAPCPILTVGPQVPSPSANHPISFKRIIYATDFSSQAAKAANLALSLGKRDGAQLYLCNVITEKDGSGNYDYESTSRSSLQALMPDSAYDWCHPECIVDPGKSSAAILALAKRVDADLIVLGARKDSFWIEYVRTGLTPALLAFASCPVLSVC
jgi:nucleotide-binding universal stress UspA family protein